MKTITEMAREAGIEDAYFHKPHPGVMAQLERFAELVRADEREACAKVCEYMAEGGDEDYKWGRQSAAIAIRARSQA